MARVDAPELDTTFYDRADQLDALIAEVESPPCVATFSAALDTYNLSTKRDGYIVKFWVDLEHAADVFKLNEAIERLVTVTVTRHSRRGTGDGSTHSGLLPQAPNPGAGDGWVGLLPAGLMGVDDE